MVELSIFTTFVANRIGEIQSLTNPDQWKYVCTYRIEPSTLFNKRTDSFEVDGKKSWWKGPKYLQEFDEKWPKNIVPGASEQAKTEIKKRYLKIDSLSELEATNAQSATLMMIEKFSNKVPWRLSPE